MKQTLHGISEFDKISFFHLNRGSITLYFTRNLVYFITAFLLFTAFTTSAQYTKQWSTEQFRASLSSFEYVRASTVDQNQNIIIASQNGRLPGTINTILYKYNNAGSEQWRVIFDRENTYTHAQPTAVQTDAEGNVLILIQLNEESNEKTSKLVKYNSLGEVIWSRTLASSDGSKLNATDLQVGKDGSVYASGTHDDKIITQKITSGNTIAWEDITRKYQTCQVVSLALDDKGAVYITGSGFTDNESDNSFLLKYNTETGNLLFIQDYDHPSDVRSEEFAQRVITHPDGSVYVLLNSTLDYYQYTSELILLKYGADGDLIKVTTVGATSESRYMDAALLDNGDLVILGREAKYRQTADYFLTRVSGGGQKAWYKTYNVYQGNMIRETAPVKLAVNGQNRIAVTGHTAFFQVPPTWFMIPVYTETPELVTILYDGNGEEIWQATHSQNNGTFAEGKAIHFDASNALCLAGSVTDERRNTLSELIALRYTAEETSPDCAGGFEAGAGEDQDICAGGSVQLQATGGVTYSWAPATGLSATDIANPMANPETTTTYTVTITHENGCTQTDEITVNVNEMQRINLTYNADICIADGMVTLTLPTPSGGTYTGRGVNQNGFFDPFLAGVGTHIITYVHKGSSCSTIVNLTLHVTNCKEEKQIEKLTLYPNPTTGFYNIEFPVKDVTDVSVKLINLNGTVVLHDTYRQVTRDFVKKLDLSDKAKGTYFLQITTNDGVVYGRVVLR